MNSLIHGVGIFHPKGNRQRIFQREIDKGQLSPPPRESETSLSTGVLSWPKLAYGHSLTRIYEPILPELSIICLGGSSTRRRHLKTETVSKRRGNGICKASHVSTATTSWADPDIWSSCCKGGARRLRSISTVQMLLTRGKEIPQEQHLAFENISPKTLPEYLQHPSCCHPVAKAGIL